MLKIFFAVSIMLFSQLMMAQIEQGGGEVFLNQNEKCLSDQDREELKIELEEIKSSLISQGILPKKSKKSNLVTYFNFPLKASSNLFYESFYGVSNYVDQDNSTGIEDYNCSLRTYNSHKGTDYFTYPFPWFMVENDLVEVVAAADGIIISKIDGNPDDHCSCYGNWNAVYIQHPDGSVSWYGHLKTNSLTSKSIGQSVVQGEYLGIVASSGCSTNPHLHFEVYDPSNNLIDPYSGSCNQLNSTSWWNTQPNYTDPKVNALMTHNAPPIHGCPGNSESPNIQNNFYTGQTIYFAAYFIDQMNGDITNIKIRRPDQSIYDQWIHNSPGTYVASWWYWSRNLPTNGPFGIWTLEVVYNGVSYSHEFRYQDGSCSTQQINTWVGPNNGVWNYNRNNWSLGFVPSACDIVIIPPGKQVSLVDGEEYSCYKLELGAGAQLVMHPNNIMNISVQP